MEQDPEVDLMPSRIVRTHDPERKLETLERQMADLQARVEALESAE
jgi:hypothetical protein